MKKKITLLVFTIFSINLLIAQSIDFPTSEATWKYNRTDDSWRATTQFMDFHMSGDTIINALTYQSVVASNNEFSGFFRSEGNQIYFLPIDSTEAYLLYDFDLIEGDTFINQWSFYPDNGDPDTVYVNQIDSVLINNIYRKQWYFDNGGKWIEGIGSTYLLTRPIYLEPLSSGYRLFCFKKEEEWILETSAYIYGTLNDTPIGELTCDGYIVSTEENLISNEKIKISPNPFVDQFDILSPKIPDGTTIQIFSIHGKLIKAIQYQSPIVLSDIPSGTYLLSFSVNQHLYTSLLQKL